MDRRFASDSAHFSEAKKVYKIHNLTDEEATLVEPAACAIHGMDRLNAAVGIDAFIIGAGPTGKTSVDIHCENSKYSPPEGLILAQLLKLNGAAKVVIAANKGIKTQVAKDLDAGDVYIELDRDNPGPQWQQLKDDNPYGFDVVVNQVLNPSIPRRRCTILAYIDRGHWLSGCRQRSHQLCSSWWDSHDLWCLFK